jgi:2-haloacid dehalogenase/putative hydrolase of the HAD superfamily
MSPSRRHSYGKYRAMIANRQPRALLLDFYGTVVQDDDEPLAEICRRVAAASPYAVTAREVGAYWSRSFAAWCARSHGPTFRTQRAIERLSLREVLEHFSGALDAEALSSSLYEYWVRPPLWPESVDGLSQCDVPLCLVSNIDDADLQTALVHNELIFEHVVTSEGCQAYKPRREMFERALKVLGLPPAEVLHVGDSLGSDVRGARQAGMPVLWINRRGRTLPDGAPAPDYVGTDLSSLLAHVATAAPSVAVSQATSPLALGHARALFLEYAEGLGIDLAFQDFESELASLPGAYIPPRGALLLATYGVQVAGCAALRPFQGEICEMKRLYVRPRCRKRGIGRTLAAAILSAARRAGYAHMRLDTLPWMNAAIALYRSMGFHEILSYRHNPVPGTVYMERAL